MKYTYLLVLLKSKQMYKIHGLWIDYSDGGYPSYCKENYLMKHKFYQL